MKLSGARLLICLLILINLTPVWLFRYFPTQDGATHVHTAQAIKDYNKAENTTYREYYKPNWSPFPNWGAQIVLIIFMYVVPPLIAEKLLLTLYIVLFPLSIIYLINSVRGKSPGVRISELLGILFVHNYVLYMGFYSFVLSLLPCFFGLGYWWKNRDSFRVKQFLILNVMFFLAYFAHIVSYVMLLFSIAIIALLYFAVESFRRDGTDGILKRCLSNLARFSIVLSSFIPSLILMYMYLRKSGTGRAYADLRVLLGNLFPIEALYYISNNQKIIAYPVSVLIILLLLYTLFRDKFSVNGTSLEVKLEGRDYFLIASLAALIIYLWAPMSLSRGGYMNYRLIIYPPLFLLPWLSDRYNAILKRIVMGVIILLCVVNVSMLNYYVSKFNGVMKEFASGVDLVGENNPIIGLMRDRGGWFLRVEPYAGGTNYYCIDNGNVNLVNYQADQIYFGINFKPELNRPPIGPLAMDPKQLDFGNYTHVPYIVAWGLADDSPVDQNVKKYYELIKKTEHLKIFKSLEQAENTNLQEEKNGKTGS